MDLFPRESLDRWWQLLKLERRHVMWLQRQLEKEIRADATEDGDAAGYVEIRISDQDEVDKGIVREILNREAEYRQAFGEGKEDSFFFRYVYEWPGSRSIRIDVGKARGIIWIWEELEKDE